jgi:hypothetical protein
MKSVGASGRSSVPMPSGGIAPAAGHDAPADTLTTPQATSGRTVALRNRAAPAPGPSTAADGAQIQPYPAKQYELLDAPRPQAGLVRTQPMERSTPATRLSCGVAQLR